VIADDWHVMIKGGHDRPGKLFDHPRTVYRENKGDRGEMSVFKLAGRVIH
jgi:hypothetical protein